MYWSFMKISFNLFIAELYKSAYHMLVKNYVSQSELQGRK